MLVDQDMGLMFACFLQILVCLAQLNRKVTIFSDRDSVKIISLKINYIQCMRLSTISPRSTTMVSKASRPTGISSYVDRLFQAIFSPTSGASILLGPYPICFPRTSTVIGMQVICGPHHH